MSPTEHVTSIKGIGDNTAQKLNRLKITTVIDLIRMIPRRYLDYSKPCKIKDIKENKKNVSFLAELTDTKVFYTKNKKLITQSIAKDSTGKIKLIWFNNPYIKKLIKPNQTYTIAGQTSLFSESICLVSPTIEEGQNFSLNTKGLVPVYPQTKGLKSSQLRKYIYNCLKEATFHDPLLPLAKYQQNTTLSEAYQNIHFPSNQKDKTNADKRLSFNEHLKISLKNQLELKNLGGSPFIKINSQVHQKGLNLFPFKLTQSQQTATKSILNDLTKEEFTHRLVQGDTGSGKTATIILASNQAISSGYSCVLLAPTQILANQHFLSFQQYSLYPQNITLVTSKNKSTTSKEPTIYIGTHSLLNKLINKTQKIIFFAIDEQHKFGVTQREFFNKQSNPPHVINLSATPIPRTVAQGLLGEIKISTIKSKPLGRLPIKTHIVKQSYFNDKGFNWLTNKIEDGVKAFIVAPNIFDNEVVSSVESLQKKYRQHLPPNIPIYVIHGKIKPEIQNKIMSDFTKEKSALLISTSLIEVGIDVKTANIIIIHSAERFGLAQLHQLRGRVGRNDQQGYCFLIPSQDDQEEIKRLKLLTKYNSGLILAKKDLILRGSGEVFGTKQHGTFQTRLKHFWSRKSYLTAKNIAKEILKKNQDEAKIIATNLDSC